MSLPVVTSKAAKWAVLTWPEHVQVTPVGADYALTLDMRPVAIIDFEPRPALTFGEQLDCADVLRRVVHKL